MRERKTDERVTLEDIMRMFEKDERCAKAALIISVLSGLMIAACAIFKIFQPVGQ